MKIVECRQGSETWFNARIGRVTASEVADALCFLKRGEDKGKEGKTRASFKAALVSEILTGHASDTFVSSYMKYGTEMEPFARAAYEVKYDVSVETVGFVIHPSIERSGASPDGLIGKDGGLEIKAPKTETHLAYMLAGCVPPEYEPQVMWNLACTEREWWDFCSFDARLPVRHQIFCKRMYRNEARIAEMEEGVRQFLSEVDELIAKLEALNPEQGQFQRDLRASVDDIGDLGITDDDLPAWAREEIAGAKTSIPGVEVYADTTVAASRR